MLEFDWNKKITLMNRGCSLLKGYDRSIADYIDDKTAIVIDAGQVGCGDNQRFGYGFKVVDIQSGLAIETLCDTVKDCYALYEFHKKTIKQTRDSKNYNRLIERYEAHKKEVRAD